MMTKIIQALVVALLIVMGIGNVAMYSVARDAQRQGQAQTKALDYEWMQVEHASNLSQRLLDRVGADEARLDRLERGQELMERETNDARAEQEDIREEMRAIRDENEHIRRIIYLDERARIAADNAREIHDLLKK